MLAAPPGASVGPHRRIDLPRNPTRPYAPDEITTVLRHELARFANDLAGQQVGLLFTDRSAVMTSLADLQAIIEFEPIWGSVVRAACASIGAHAAWNVCVYELDAFRVLRQPVEAVVDLIRSHDTVWAARNNRVVSGGAAARRVLEQLRPATVTRHDWHTSAGRLVRDLGLVG